MGPDMRSVDVVVVLDVEVKENLGVERPAERGPAPGTHLWDVRGVTRSISALPVQTGEERH